MIIMMLSTIMILIIPIIVIMMIMIITTTLSHTLHYVIQQYRALSYHNILPHVIIYYPILHYITIDYLIHSYIYIQLGSPWDNCKLAGTQTILTHNILCNFQTNANIKHYVVWTPYPTQNICAIKNMCKTSHHS